jgi:hypothetical protein
MSVIESKQLFNEFIQFVYTEVQSPGWRDRMDDLCSENIVLSCQQSRRHFKTLHEIAEEEEEDDYGLVMTIIFKELALEEYWFKSWVEHTYPEQEWSWDLRDKFRWYMLGLSYEVLMDIVEMGMIYLK